MSLDFSAIQAATAKAAGRAAGSSAAAANADGDASPQLANPKLSASPGSCDRRGSVATEAAEVMAARTKKGKEAPPVSPFTVNYESEMPGLEPTLIPAASAADLVASATSLVKPASVEEQVASAIAAAETGPVESVTFTDGQSNSFIQLVS